MTLGRPPYLNELFPVRYDERVTIVGASGNGKSFLARALLRSFRDVPRFIYDSKGSSSLDSPEDWRTMHTLDDLEELGYRQHRNDSVIYRPRWDMTKDEYVDEIDKLCRWAYVNGGKGRKLRFYIDETGMVVKGASESAAPASLIGLATRGREKGVGLWIGTQRPANIPFVLLSEANHFFVFGLRLPQDRKRMAEAAEMDIEGQIARLKKREFLYINPAENKMSGPHVLAPR